MTSSRARLARLLTGDGIEIGPGHVPFPVSPGVQVRYVDRWSPEENATLFSELSDPTFPKPDVVADLDVDQLRAFESESLAFVIASHVLEHLADPIGMLVELHRVVAPWGQIILMLPDRRMTFDRDRRPTPLAHLVDEHRRGVTVVDDAHVLDFLEHVEHLDPTAIEPSYIEWHRRRSVHAHCWTDEEFSDVLVHVVRHEHLGLELEDLIVTGDRQSNGDEFGYRLRKVPSDRFESLAFAMARDLVDQRAREAKSLSEDVPDPHAAALSAGAETVRGRRRWRGSRHTVV